MTAIGLFVPLPDAQLKRLENGLSPDDHLAIADPRDCAHLREFEVIFGNPPPELLPTAERLKWLQLESVGFGEYTSLGLEQTRRDLVVTNLSGFFAEPVAETALAGILALLRGVDMAVELKLRKQWEGDALRPQLELLHRARVVMIGFGAINQRLAQLLGPFECSISSVSSNASLAELDAVLKAADIVVATAPDTPATRNLFDAERISLIQPHAIFANLGRGTIVVEEALVAALSIGKLRGAVLDVTLEEPLPPENPLWTCRNVLLTQHSGGGTRDELARKVDVFLDNLMRFKRGAQLLNVVNFRRGY